MSFGSNFGGRGKKGRITVTGDDEILELMRLLEPKLAKKAVRKSLRKGAKEIILPEAKNRVPVDTGDLDEALTVRAMKRSRSRVGYEVIVRHTSDAAKYAAKVEFGNKNHPAQSFLRASGYGNERRILNFVVLDVKEQIAEFNKAAK